MENKTMTYKEWMDGYLKSLHDADGLTVDQIVKYALQAKLEWCSCWGKCHCVVSEFNVEEEINKAFL